MHRPRYKEGDVLYCLAWSEFGGRKQFIIERDKVDRARAGEPEAIYDLERIETIVASNEFGFSPTDIYESALSPTIMGCLLRNDIKLVEVFDCIFELMRPIS